MKKIILFTLFISIAATLGAQFVVEPADNIRTVEFYTSKPSAILPVVRLGDAVHLEFDDITADMSPLRYSLERRDAQWNASDLYVSEYIEGFADGLIGQVESSFNTLVPFSHYTLSLPNERTKITRSGNYILSIFLNDPKDPLFSLKFVIYEPLVTISGQAMRASDLSDNMKSQQVEFSVDLSGMAVANPGKDITVDIMQNSNPLTLRQNVIPSYVSPQSITFTSPKAPVFFGNNQLRNFDTKDLRNASMYVGRIDLENIYNVHLKTDLPKRDIAYLSYDDIGGRFLVATLRGGNAALDADYSWVNFYLKTDELPRGEELYVAGAFNGWSLSPQYRMVYDKRGGYSASVLLKQGFYDYGYVVKNARTGDVSLQAIDGSFYQTKNTYQVLVYYKDPSQRGDRCIGYVVLPAQGK